MQCALFSLLFFMHTVQYSYFCPLNSTQLKSVAGRLNKRDTIGVVCARIAQSVCIKAGYELIGIREASFSLRGCDDLRVLPLAPVGYVFKTDTMRYKIRLCTALLVMLHKEYQFIKILI